MKNITFIIFAFNEAHRIKYPIELFLKFGDVLIVDNTSTDDTASISKKLGAQVINRQKTNLEIDVTESKEMADWIFKYVKTEWVYWGYADEMLTESCLLKYLDIIKNGKKKIIFQNYLTYLYGDKKPYVNHLFCYRVFKKGAIDFYPRNQSIHKLGEINKNILPSEIEFLPIDSNFSIHHFSVYNTKKLTNNHNLYSDIHSQVESTCYRRIDLFWKPISCFIVFYFINKNFLHGLRGLVASIQYALYFFMVEAKKYEIYNNITLDSIEADYSIFKSQILKNNFVKEKSKFQLVYNKIKFIFIKNILFPIYIKFKK